MLQVNLQPLAFTNQANPLLIQLQPIKTVWANIKFDTIKNLTASFDNFVLFESAQPITPKHTIQMHVEAGSENLSIACGHASPLPEDRCKSSMSGTLS